MKYEKPRLLLALSLSAVALVLLWFVLLSSAPSRPTLLCFRGTCDTPSYLASLMAYDSALWWRNTGLEISEGLFIVAGLSLLRLPELRIRGFNIQLPRAARDAVLLGAVSLLLVFVVMLSMVTLGGADTRYTLVGEYLLYSAGSYSLARGVSNTFVLDNFGAVAFGLLCLSLLCFTVYWLSGGLRRALVRAIRLGMIVLIAYESVLLIVLPSAMIWHVASFAHWNIGSVPLLSNWVALIAPFGVLIVSSRSSLSSCSC